MSGPSADETPTTKQWACLPRGRASPSSSAQASANTAQASANTAQASANSAQASATGDQESATPQGDRVQEVHTATIRAKQRAVRESSAKISAEAPKA